MRVAVVAPPWLPVPPPSYGGIETVVDQLCRGLQQRGHEVVLFAHPDSTCPVALHSIVPADEVEPMGRARIELEHALGAYALARGCDVVSDHTVGGPVCAASFPGLPVVATNHNPFTRSAEAIYGAASARVALVAISYAHAASTRVPVSAVVHHGIDVGSFPAGAGRGGYLAMLTRMSPDKGVHRAIRVARATGMPLRIAAKMRDPRERDYFDRVVRPLLSRDIEYLGEVDAEGKKELLADAVAMLNPIEWDEPFGMAMIESLACGTPVVTCPRGAAPEIVVDGLTGFLGHDDAALCAAVERAASLDRVRCREWIAEHFSVDRMVQGYVAILGETIERSRRRADARG